MQTKNLLKPKARFGRLLCHPAKKRILPILPGAAWDANNG